MLDQRALAGLLGGALIAAVVMATGVRSARASGRRRYGVDTPRRQQAFIALLIGLIVAAIVALTVRGVLRLADQAVWAMYGIVVTSFLLSRFALGHFYNPQHPVERNDDRLPTMTIIVPAMNEEDGIVRTLEWCLGTDYPTDKLQVIAVDDGSTDRTASLMRSVERRYPNQLEVIEHVKNQGKREAMLNGLMRATGELIVFIDSDSLIKRDALRRVVSYFRDPSVGAVTGHTDVYNRDANVLTKMQAVRYYVAFRAYKSAEALFGSVTCCAGCFSAYRRTAIDAVAPRWINQSFLGERSTFGDDRSLTNALLPTWKVLYAPDAQAYTIVPEKFKTFMRQQLRWKKSWIRECLRASTFMWRKHPAMALSFYAGMILPVLGPIIIMKTMFVHPFFGHQVPLLYLAGLVIVALLYGLYYRMHRRERIWVHGVLFGLFYATVLVWQLPYAIATLRNSKWGTR